MERKRAAQQEEARRQEQQQRQEAERQRERERAAAAEDPKKIAQKQAIEKRRMELNRKEQQPRMPQRPAMDQVCQLCLWSDLAMADFSRHPYRNTRLLPRRLVQTWVALGLHQGYTTYQLIRAFPMLTFRTLLNQPTSGSSTLTPRTNLLYKVACKALHYINRTTENGGGQKTKSCRTLESDQQWRLPSANRGFARTVTKHPSSAAIIRRHHHLRLTIIMHLHC